MEKRQWASYINNTMEIRISLGGQASIVFHAKMSNNKLCDEMVMVMELEALVGCCMLGEWLLTTLRS